MVCEIKFGENLKVWKISWNIVRFYKRGSHRWIEQQLGFSYDKMCPLVLTYRYYFITIFTIRQLNYHYQFPTHFWLPWQEWEVPAEVFHLIPTICRYKNWKRCLSFLEVCFNLCFLSSLPSMWLHFKEPFKSSRNFRF